MRYAVLLSGGVDSSTALWELTRDPANDIIAYYLKVWLEDELESLGDCPWEEDLSFARQVCEAAGVPLNVVSLQLEYYDRVVSYAIEELRAGRTPSPDIFCNERIKFGAFLDHLAAGHEPDTRIATGHYARITDEGDHVLLRRSPDPVKDQTYFLAHLGQHQLRQTHFPLGTLTKAEVRRRAADYDLPNKDRPDSQGICFLGKVRYPDFIRHYLGETSGPIVEAETGLVLGQHRGYWFYTIGQRQGLGLGGGPWYVVGKDTDSNTVHVSHSEGAEDRARNEFHIEDLSWTWQPPTVGRVLVKIRHGPALVGASIGWIDDDRMRVTMDSQDRGVAPGQFAVLYNDDVCLGCGRIAGE
ncbi:MAG: tRNA 2-thiouridine(34) synthase MnmA [Spirochaetales bacterium]|nr:tRNA 2-thiouridine(34) synthase MnmA [Spirochaetales bacterium]